MNLDKHSKKHKIAKFLKKLFSRKIVLVGACGVAFFILVALLAPLLAPYDPNKAEFAESLQQPSAAHWLGTDMYGRDVLSLIIYGTRVSLIVGVFAVMVACVIGTVMGLCASYFGGWVDNVISRLTEAIKAVPRVVLAMALTAVFGSSMTNLAIILGITTIPGYVRMIRSQALAVKEADYVMAAKLQGSSDLRIMFTHILPNSISPIIVMMTQQVGGTILAEAGLSFLGVGISAPTASWGTMVSEGQAYLLQNPVFALAPGICVALLVICLNSLGDGVRDALDPRLNGEV